MYNNAVKVFFLKLRTERIKTTLSQSDKTENVFPARVMQRTFMGDCLNYYLKE